MSISFLQLTSEKEATDVRGAIIYDINGSDVILSQTNPPVTGGRHIGKYVSVTYLIREQGDVARYGFEGKVIDVIKEYNLSSSKMVSAILIKKHTGIKQYDLRMHYRVKPKLSDGPITLYMENKKASLLDIRPAVHVSAIKVIGLHSTWSKNSFCSSGSRLMPGPWLLVLRMQGGVRFTICEGSIHEYG